MGARSEHRWENFNRRYFDAQRPKTADQTIARVIAKKIDRETGGPLSGLTGKPSMPTKNQVRNFMIADAPTCKTATELAESAAAHFKIDHAGGPLDDDTHWIWDVAHDEFDRAQELGQE